MLESLEAELYSSSTAYSTICVKKSIKNAKKKGTSGVKRVLSWWSEERTLFCRSSSCRTPCGIQQLLLYYYICVPILVVHWCRRRSIPGAATSDYDISSKLISAVKWSRRRSIRRATTTTWCTWGCSSYVAQTSFPARFAAVQGKRRMLNVLVELALASNRLN